MHGQNTSVLKLLQRKDTSNSHAVQNLTSCACALFTSCAPSSNNHGVPCLHYTRLQHAFSQARKLIDMQCSIHQAESCWAVLMHDANYWVKLSHFMHDVQHWAILMHDAQPYWCLMLRPSLIDYMLNAQHWAILMPDAHHWAMDAQHWAQDWGIFLMLHAGCTYCASWSIKIILCILKQQNYGSILCTIAQCCTSMAHWCAPGINMTQCCSSGINVAVYMAQWCASGISMV